MKYSIAIVVSITLLTVAFANQSGKGAGQGIVIEARDLLSSKQTDRSLALKHLHVQYNAMRTKLDKVLNKAAKKDKNDGRYMSPLHAAILAVQTWRIYEAEDTLLSVIEYELDAGSTPPGVYIAGYSFYPAAAALVELRVDTTKVVNAITTAKSEKTLQLLTWVLYRRTDAPKETLRMLDEAGGETPNANIKRALQLVKSSESHSDILPN